ncbi:MAG: CRISPR system precrRNA processing endoribonuclease RAMP protein Cas6 [Anaerolineae bacterium]|nr:CRISPR system precrRNA processing endoribonuclease RAMP protein Cas6 [Anaerolineae bacterium]
MTDLLALTLLLDIDSARPLGRAAPGREGVRSLGRAAHSWFLHTVTRLDPRRAEALHQAHDLRAFSLWPALDQTPPFLRIASIDPDLSAFLLDRWLPNLPTPFDLSYVRCACRAVAQHPVQHPWAGQTTYAHLIQSATPPDARRAAPGVDLCFATPTSFRSHNLDVPLPLPTLIFDGLLEKWNRFAPVGLDDDLKTWVQEHVAIGRYRLETRLLSFDGRAGLGRDGGGDRAAGFCGSCRLAFVDADPVHQAMVTALAGFAFYAGVGRRTTMGMGQVRMGDGERGVGG